MEKLSLYVLSDSLGETGELMLKACLSQFPIQNYVIKRFSHVLTLEFLDAILDEAKENHAIVAYTLVKEEMVAHIQAFSHAHGVESVDLVSGILNAIHRQTGIKPKREAGVIRKLNEDYFKRVSAMEFAVKYDDGKDARGILEADVVLVGISRTSKTPLALFLANNRLKVANVPLVPQVQPPKELFLIPARKVFGLTNTPEKLNAIRETRLTTMGLPAATDYSDMNHILEELDYGESIMKRIGCPIIDVSNKAIEETAELILSML